MENDQKQGQSEQAQKSQEENLNKNHPERPVAKKTMSSEEKGKKKDAPAGGPDGK
jgi:hypothetical protein